MSVKKHPDYKAEVERLEYTKEYIKNTLDATEEYRRKYKENIKDAMIELDHLDSSQSYISIILNTKFMEMAERNYGSLMKVRNKPYFARIDFKRKDKENIENLYIGKTSLMRAEDEIPLIIDWRSPVANIYYDGRLGEVSYKTETGIENGEVLLKRQFAIEGGKLENILDIDITTNDTFLQAALEANVDNRLKDIASTIQSEQNRVIRADMGNPLIVQGVAGSGKTTIALHRISYFIYTYEKIFDPENFMIIAPNKLFINYISEVLPELGVENVKQTTFIDFMVELIGNKYKLTNPNELLLKLISETKKKDIESMKWMSSFKGSLEFKEIIDNYLRDIEENFVPAIDIKLEGQIIESYKEIKNMFIKELKYLPFYSRIKKIKSNISNILKPVKKEILERTEINYNNEIDRIRDIMEDSEEKRQIIIALIKERDDKLEFIKKESKGLIKDYLSKFEKRDLFDYYGSLVTNREGLLKYSNGKLTEEQAEYLSKTYTKLLSNKKIELEDYASLAYMKHKVLGFDKEIKINSVVIDEAQDFSLFQFFTLKTILKTNMFTILGDISQGIHSYRAINNWEEVIEKIFNKEDTNYRTLVQSYRTTVEIMDFANKIIKKLDNDKIVLAKPVIRHGEKPEIKEFISREEISYSLEKKIEEMKDEKFNTIAVICKTIEECEALKKHLDKTENIRAKIISDKDEIYHGGVQLVPVHLSKGLEFDVVFIVTLDGDYEEKEIDIKLLYVAMTRALHRLYIYYKKDHMKLLQDIN